jgi:tetratricopeptide (TPR) repeat protein
MTKYRNFDSKIKTINQQNFNMMSQQIKLKLFYLLVATLVFFGCQSEVENPFQKGPYVQTLKQTEMTIVWEGDTTYAGKVYYGIGDKLDLVAEVSDHSKVQKVVLKNLQPETEYSYQVEVNRFKSEKYSFRTAVKDGSPFLFAAYGDNKNGPFNHKRIADLILSYQPLFVANNGDLVDRGGVFKQWDKLFFTPAQKMISSIPLIPSIGNHEDNSKYYYDYFCLPNNKAWHSFDLNGAHFIVVNTEEEFIELDGEQLTWLENDLKNNSKTWTFVFQHVPPFTSGGNYYSKSRIEVKNIFHPLYEKYGVDMVLTGHDHHYERSKPIGSKNSENAVIYIVGGNGGTSMRYIGKPKPFSLISTRTFGFSLIEIDGGKMKFKEISIENEILDEFEIDKGNSESYLAFLKNKILFEEIIDPIAATKLYGKGDDLCDEDKFEEALLPLLEAYKIDNECEEATALIAECYLELGDYENASKFAQITIDITPLLPDSYEVFAEIEKEKDEFEKAIEWYEKLNVVAPDSPDALLEIADIYLDKKEYEKAIQTFKQAIEVLPNDWEIHFSLAELFEELGRNNEALTEYKLTVEWFYDEEEDDDHLVAIKKIKELSE